MTEVRGGLEEVKELSQQNLIRRGVAKIERREVR